MQETTCTIEGTLRRIKENERTIIYNIELESSIRGISGSVYIDRSYLPYFNRLVLAKEINNEHWKFEPANWIRIFVGDLSTVDEFTDLYERLLNECKTMVDRETESRTRADDRDAQLNE